MYGVSISPFLDFPSEAEFNKVSKVVTHAKNALEPLEKQLETFKNKNVVLVIDPSEGSIGVVTPIKITEIKEQLQHLKTQFKSDTKECRVKFTNLISPINRLFKELILFCDHYSQTPPLSKI